MDGGMDGGMEGRKGREVHKKRGMDGGKERSRQEEEGRRVRYLLRLPIYV